MVARRQRGLEVVVPHARLREVLRAPDVRSILLERPVREVDCSLRWSLRGITWVGMPSVFCIMSASRAMVSKCCGVWAAW